MLTVISKEQIEAFNKNPDTLKVNKNIRKRLCKIKSDQYPTDWDLVLVETTNVKVNYIHAIKLNGIIIAGYTVLYADNNHYNVVEFNKLIPHIVIIDGKLYQFNYNQSKITVSVNGIVTDDKTIKIPKNECTVIGVCVSMCDSDNEYVLDAYMIDDDVNIEPTIIFDPVYTRNKKKQPLVDAMRNYIYDNIIEIWTKLN